MLAFSGDASGVIKLINLGEYFPAFRALFIGIGKHPEILVRDEYRTALDALQGDEYYRGAYVMGHRSIGSLAQEFGIR